MDLLPYERPGLFGREPAQNAFVELHNVVAAAGSAGELGRNVLDRIARARGVDLRQQFRDERLGLYHALFDEALADGRFSPDDRRWLGAVAETLALTAADVAPVHERAFGDAVGVVLSDECLGAGERLHLHALQRELGVDANRAGALYQSPARSILLRQVATTLCDGELSPDEGARIAQAAGALGIVLDTDISAMLSQAAGRWESRSGPLPHLPGASVPLHKDEVAHAEVPVRWARKTRDELRDAFARDLSRAETRHQRLPWHRFMAPPRPGRLVLTNRRLVVADDARAPTWVSLIRIRETVAFKDGLVVQVQGASRGWVLDLGSDARALSALLDRAADAIRPRTPPRGAAAWWRPLTVVSDARRLARAPLGWSLPGGVRGDGARLVLHDVTGETHIPLPRVTGVERHEAVLEIAERDRAGWLLYFSDPEQAEALSLWIAAHTSG